MQGLSCASALWRSRWGLAGGAHGSVARAAKKQIALFLASNGRTINDPDGSDTLFELPIPLPETTSFNH
jgi:hypothetical protein